jgi:hypothetical protein
VGAQRPVVGGLSQQVAHALPSADGDVVQGVGQRLVPEGGIEVGYEAAAYGHVRHFPRRCKHAAGVRSEAGGVRDGPGGQ